MSHVLRITRGHWSDRNKPKITAEEWMRLVDADPDLVPDKNSHSLESEPGQHKTLLVRWPSEDEDPSFVYSYNEGTVRVKGAGNHTIRKMLELAAKLDAFVQGESDERYRLTEHGVEYYHDPVDDNPPLTVDGTR